MIELSELPGLAEELTQASLRAAERNSLQPDERLSGKVIEKTTLPSGVTLYVSDYVAVDRGLDENTVIDGICGVIREPDSTSDPEVSFSVPVSRTLSVTNGTILVEESVSPRNVSTEEETVYDPVVVTGERTGVLHTKKTILDTQTGQVTIQLGDTEIRNKTIEKLDPVLQIRRINALGTTIRGAIAIFDGISAGDPHIEIKKSPKSTPKFN